MDVRNPLDRQILEGRTARNPRSTVQIAGHPIHPMLVPFPIAFFVATFVVDIAFLSTGYTGWVLASQWLLGAGLVMAALAAIIGLTDFAGERQIRKLSAAWWHAGANITAVLLSLWNFIVRVSAGAVAGLSSGEVILSALVVLILLFSGWMGWAMVYKHHVGVAD